MSVESSDVEYVKSIAFSDESSNGGRRGKSRFYPECDTRLFPGFRKANGWPG